ncbi:MAG: flagellar basal body P-ring protein FlgI [Thermodesulfobacteriota bacterium]|nr:flagellar basal body P-ring protein FlgI [Thermodesulfobacteriota bacterium]
MKVTVFIISLLYLGTLPNILHGARIKDISDFGGVRINNLIGYGLIVGLDGTGDDTGTEFTVQTLVSMLDRMGITVNKKDVEISNVAAVILTANLPPFAKVGTTVDVLVSSLGDAESLQGGTLLYTPLRGADGNVYVMAQGAVSIGGFQAGGASGSEVQKNHPTVGRVIGGGMVEREVPFIFRKNREITICLHNADFTTSSKLSKIINEEWKEKIAYSCDAGSVNIKIPEEYNDRIVDFVAELEILDVPMDSVAKVVLNERTGTIVMGENVRIDTIALSHGNLNIVIKEDKDVNQPLPFSGGQTVVTPESEVIAEEEKGGLVIVSSGVTINEVVKALNAIGVSPRDLITIFQVIKASGALRAELEII